MNFCFIFKLTRVDVGNVSKKSKNMKVLLLEVFLLGGFSPNSVYVDTMPYVNISI